LNTGPNMCRDYEAHTLRAGLACVRNVAPPKPPRKTRRELKDTKPRRRGLLQSPRLRQGRSKRIVRLPLRIVREVRVKPTTATNAYPTLARM
jgi:hypothetical protein